jgi:zinc and cadmium transporter
MDRTLLYIITAVVLDGMAGLSGGVLPVAFIHKNLATLLAFASGTLVASAFLDLLPHALHSGINPGHIMYATMAGFFAFYVIESLLGSHAAGQSGHKHSTVGPMILIGDALHNAADGLAIAAAFMADVQTGVVTTIAVIVHELPQEIGDFTILVSHGYSRNRALFLLVLVQLSAVVGALGAVWASSMMEVAAPYLMAISAGGFLYIASADLLPELQRQKGECGAAKRLISFSAGIVIVATLERFL